MTTFSQSLSPVHEQARSIMLRRRNVSVSLLQRCFRMGYAATLALMDELERHGIVTIADEQGRRGFGPNANFPLEEDLQENAAFQEWALSAYSGCDGGDPGSAANPSIWMFGIEHGDSTKQFVAEPNDETYSIAAQSRYRYNQRAFMLLSAMHGGKVSEWQSFAEQHQPWVKGSSGFFKGNLYPYPCKNVGTWTNEVQQYTGFSEKSDYMAWCRAHRLPVIKRWSDRYMPKVVIGVGITCRDEYCMAFFGAVIPMILHTFVVNGYVKKIYHTTLNGKILVVIPHISSSRHGLNSDVSLQMAGEFIRSLGW